MELQDLLQIEEEQMIARSEVLAHSSNTTDPTFVFVAALSSTHPQIDKSYGQNKSRCRCRGKYTYQKQKIYCQICKKVGHSAFDCFYRHDHSFQCPTQAQNTDFTANNSTRLPAYYLSSAPSSMFHNPPLPNYTTHAYYPSPAVAPAYYPPPTVAPPDGSWYLDTGASNHVSPNINSLAINSPYSGPNKIIVGNDQNLPIQHIGPGVVSTSNHSFHLHNILHVPNITTKLLSVHKFAQDNNCVLSFDATSFVIQDRASKQVIQ